MVYGVGEFSQLKKEHLILELITNIQNHHIQNMPFSLDRKGKEDKLKAKTLHGQLFELLDQQYVDKEASLAWFQSSGFKGEMESLLLAA